MDNGFYIKLWGVRDAVPVVGKEFNYFCINISCIQDVGTGIRNPYLYTDIFHLDVLRDHTHPTFPLNLANIYSQVEFNDFVSGKQLKNKSFKKAGITINTLALNYPDGATANVNS